MCVFLLCVLLVIGVAYNRFERHRIITLQMAIMILKDLAFSEERPAHLSREQREKAIVSFGQYECISHSCSCSFSMIFGFYFTFVSFHKPCFSLNAVVQWFGCRQLLCRYLPMILRFSSALVIPLKEVCFLRCCI